MQNCNDLEEKPKRPTYGDDIIDTILKAQFRKETKKLDFIKIKKFFSAKDNVKSTKRQAIDWEKIFAKIYLIKDC